MPFYSDCTIRLFRLRISYDVRVNWTVNCVTWVQAFTNPALKPRERLKPCYQDDDDRQPSFLRQITALRDVNSKDGDRSIRLSAVTSDVKMSHGVSVSRVTASRTNGMTSPPDFRLIRWSMSCWPVSHQHCAGVWFCDRPSRRVALPLLPHRDFKVGRHCSQSGEMTL